MRATLMTRGTLALATLLPLAVRAESGGPAPSPPIHAHHDQAPRSEVPVADLLDGRGMGQEAWGAGKLRLSPEQATPVPEIVRAMASEARRLGVLVLDAERDLALAFRSGEIDGTNLRARVERIAALRGELRAVHLQAHLETRAVLDPAQLARYGELRGHPPDDGMPPHGH